MKKVLLLISLCVVPLSAMQNSEAYAPRCSGETLWEQWERVFKAQRLAKPADSSSTYSDQEAPAVKSSQKSRCCCFCFRRRSGKR